MRERERERERMFIFTSSDIMNNNSPNTSDEHVGTCHKKETFTTHLHLGA